MLLLCNSAAICNELSQLIERVGMAETGNNRPKSHIIPHGHLHSGDFRSGRSSGTV